MAASSLFSDLLTDVLAAEQAAGVPAVGNQFHFRRLGGRAAASTSAGAAGGDSHEVHGASVDDVDGIAAAWIRNLGKRKQYVAFRNAWCLDQPRDTWHVVLAPTINLDGCSVIERLSRS